MPGSWTLRIIFDQLSKEAQLQLVHNGGGIVTLSEFISEHSAQALVNSLLEQEVKLKKKARP